MSGKRLTEIANKYDTDKGTLSLHKGVCHGYTEFYDDFVKKYRDKNPNILEIGVLRGGSLQMWQEYFGENCDVVGVDNHLSWCPEQIKKSNIHLVYGEQSTPTKILSDVKKLHPQYDIIVDDASHNDKLTLDTFTTLQELVAPGGIYIIEDLHLYTWGKRYTDSMLYHLMFLDGRFISPMIVEKIKSIYTFTNCKHNDSGENSVESSFPNSITAIIEFVK